MPATGLLLKDHLNSSAKKPFPLILTQKVVLVILKLEVPKKAKSPSSPRLMTNTISKRFMSSNTSSSNSSNIKINSITNRISLKSSMIMSRLATSVVASMKTLI